MGAVSGTRRRRGVADHACAARRWQAGTGTGHRRGCLAEMCCPQAGVCCSSRTRTAGSFHHSTPCAAKGSGSVRYRSTSGERIFPQMETLWHSLSRLRSDEPHPDLFVAWRAAEGGRGGERHRSSRSRLGGTGAGFFSTNLSPSGSELLFIRLDGTSHVLWSHQEVRRRRSRLLTALIWLSQD